MNHPGKKLKVAFFSEDFSRQAKGTAIVIQKLAEEFLNDFSSEIELTLIRKAGPCENPLAKRIRNIEIKVYKSPVFPTLISYLVFFIRNREEFDAVIFNRNVYPGFWFLNVKKFILYVHDAPVNKIYKEKLTLENHLIYAFLKYVGKNFLDAFIAASDDARSGMIDFLRINPEKAFSIYGGAGSEYRLFSDQEKSRSRADLKEKYGIIAPYILDVSRLEPHKNISMLIDSFFILKNRYEIPHKLVIVGGRHLPDYNAMIDKKISDFNLASEIIIAPYIRSGDMPSVYNCADLFIFPTLMEGFGLPMVEAMKCGVPIIASNLPVLAEVSAGAAVLCDPFDPESFAAKAFDVLSSPNLRQSLVGRGLARNKIFSWRNTADKLLEIIKS